MFLREVVNLVMIECFTAPLLRLIRWEPNRGTCEPYQDLKTVWVALRLALLEATAET